MNCPYVVVVVVIVVVSIRSFRHRPSPATKESSISKLVKNAHDRIGGNVSAIKQSLEKDGVSLSRKRITKELDDQGLSRNRKR